MALAAAGFAVALSGCNVAIVAGVALLASSGKSSSRSGFTTPAPQVASIAPASGSHGGGTAVTIVGTSFSPDATVSIGGTAASDVTFVDATHMTAVVPRSSATGPVDVIVTNPVGGAGTLSHGFTYTVEKPTATIGPIASPQTGNIVVAFTLAQPEGDLVDLAVEVDAGSGFQAVPQGRVVSGALTGFAASPQGVSHTITIDSLGLLGATNASSVKVRLTPTGEVGAAAGTPAVSNAFAVANDRAPSVTIVQPATDAFDIVINFTVANAESNDSVRVTALRWRDVGSGASGDMTIRSGQRVGPIGASAGGSRASTIWSSLADLGSGNDKLVTVSITVTDGFTTATATTAPFFVSNGPLSDQVPIPAAILEGFAVADVSGDGRPDLIATNSGDDQRVGGTININLNTGRNFTPAVSQRVPGLPGSFPATPPDPANPYFYPFAHPSECAALDVNGDGRADLVAASNLYGPNTGGAFLNNVSGVLQNLGEDAPNGYAHAIAHQVSLRALQTSNGLDVANATYESTQAPVTSLATPLFLGGRSSQFSSAPTNDPGHDNVGWIVQHVLAADLDGPGVPGAGSKDLVLVEGLRDVSAALQSEDLRGVVVIRQVDPRSGALGPAYYLDPTDMGVLPAHAAVADVLSSSRATLGFSAPVGSPDIVVACPGDSALTFYLQAAPATWGSSYTPPVYTSVHFPLTALIPQLPPGDTIAVAAGDLNGDGAADLVIVGQLSKTAIVLIWDPSGPLAQQTGGLLPYRVGPVLALPELLAGRPTIRDVSSDGRAEILIPSKLTNELLLFLNTGNDAAGDPVFTRVNFAAGFEAFAACATDLDGDGRADVVVPNFETGDFSVYYQVTPGTLTARFVPIACGSSPLEVTAGDVTGDGIPEIIVPCENSNDVYVYGRDPVNLLTPIRIIDTSQLGSGATASLPVLCAVGPLSGTSRKNDIAVCMEFAPNANGIGGAFERIAGSPLGTSPNGVGTTPTPLGALGIGDVNGDGLEDILVSETSAGVISIFLGQPDGTFVRTPLQDPAIASPRTARVADIDGDGYPDVVLANSNSVAIYYGSRTGLSATATVYSTAGVVDPVSCEVADMNADGRLDVVVCGFVSVTGGCVLYQTAPRQFAVVPFLVGGQPDAIAIGDLNGDGLPDLAVCWGSDDVVAVYYQNPAAAGTTASLLAPVTYKTASIPFGCAIVDVNGDGKNDLVVAARGANSLNVFLQR